MSPFVRVSDSTAIMQYIFFALFAQGGGGELELKSIVRVCAPVQLRLSRLTRCGVRSCCHTSVLLCPLGAACTSLLLCHLQRREGLLFYLFFYFYSFTTEQLQHINPGLQYNCQHFDRWQPCRQAENPLHQCVTSSNSALLQESSRWYKVEEREELCQGGGDSAGSRSQPELWQCESLA